uniref:Ovule protein n=1 Tax=Caenorhabditis tropicalis TaxID=1561998 RepID=A0A1I7U1B1_9PELO
MTRRKLQPPIFPVCLRLPHRCGVQVWIFAGEQESMELVLWHIMIVLEPLHKIFNQLIGILFHQCNYIVSRNTF